MNPIGLTKNIFKKTLHLKKLMHQRNSITKRILFI